MIDKLWQFLKPCVNWSYDNKRCRLLHERNNVVNFNDLDKDCRGFSNPEKCAWYKYKILTDEQIRKMRQKLRENRP